MRDYGLVLSDMIERMDHQLEYIGIPKSIGLKSYRTVIENLRETLTRFHVVANVIQEIVQVIKKYFTKF